MRALVLGALVLLLAACTEETAPVLTSVTVEPAGAVPGCSPISVHLTLTGLARYAISADGRLVSAGLLYAGEAAVELRGLTDQGEEGRTNLTVTVVGVNGKPERRSLSIERSANAAPHANAGPFRRAPAGTAIGLDGGASRDPDGDELTYQWTVVEGDASLADPGSARPVVTLAQPGSATVELAVRDPEGAAGTDRVVVRADDAGGPPVFEDPDDHLIVEVDPGERVEIDVAATAPGSMPVPVRYSFRQTAGPKATIAADQSLLVVTAPSSEGLVVIEAVADDGWDEARKRIALLVGTATLEDGPGFPLAEAPESAPVLSTVTLDASQSTDPEQSKLAYVWTVEDAPAGSALGAAAIAGNGTADARLAAVVLDRVGEYRFRLRVVDAVGPSPVASDVRVTATAGVTQIEVDGIVQDVALGESGLALASTGGAVIRIDADGDVRELESSAGGVGGVAYSPSGAVFLYALNGGAAAADLVSYAVSDTTLVQELPADDAEDPPSVVHDIGVDPSTANRGDLFLATDSGFVILDVSETTAEEPIGHPLQIGGEFVHRPPTFSGEGEAALTALDVRGPVDDEITQVFFGNSFWLTVLDQPPNANFTARPIDPFADEVAEAIGAVAVSTTEELIALTGRGLVWLGGDAGADCLLSPGGSSRCPSPPADACARALSASPPVVVSDIASRDDGRFWIASSDGIRLFDPTTGTFLLLGEDEGVSGATAIDDRDGFVAVGRDGGVTLLELDSP